MKEKLTLQQIEDMKMSDKDRLLALMENRPASFADQSDEIQYYMKIGQLQGIIGAKQRLAINESILLANGFKKEEGLGDDTDYIYEDNIPIVCGDPHAETSITFRHFEGDPYYTLYADHRTKYDDPSPFPVSDPLYSRCHVFVETIQQAEDAISAVGFPFSFSLKGYKAE